MTSTGSLRVEELGVDYDGVQALRGVSAAFESCRVTALVGPSGCGKTSFLNCINRMTDLVPGCHVQGRVLLGGTDICGPDVDATVLRRRVGMIFQEPVPFPLTIRTNVQLALREHGHRDRAELERRTESALRVVGLWEEVKDRLGRPALALSGGQQQRLCIARAVALEPEVLLMDEPCSALDPVAAESIERLIRELSARCTVLVVTHNLAQARRIADEVAVFWLEEGVGRLIEHGPVERVFEDPRDPRAAGYVGGRTG